MTATVRGRSRIRLIIALTASAAIAVALVVVGIHSVSGAVTQPAPSPSVSALPSPSPSASALPSPSASSPTPPVPTTDTTAPTVSRLVFAATGFALQDDDGSEVFVHHWADPGADAVAALSDAFGSEPTRSVLEGNGTHHGDYAVYAWPGFTFYDYLYEEGGPAREQYHEPSFAQYTGNEVADVAVTGEFGLRIGMPTDEVRALGPDDELTYDVRVFLRFGLERAEVGGDHAVFVHTDAAGHVVEQITYGSYLAM